MSRSYVIRSRWGGRGDAPRTRALRDQASLILRYARRVRDEDLARFAENLSTRTGQSISVEELQTWEDGGSFPAWVLVAALELANLPSSAKRVADFVQSMPRWRLRPHPLLLVGASRLAFGPSRAVLVALAAAFAIVLALFAGGAAMLWGRGPEHSPQGGPPAFAVPDGAMLPAASLDATSLPERLIPADAHASAVASPHPRGPAVAIARPLAFGTFSGWP